MAFFNQKSTADQVNLLLSKGRPDEAVNLCRKACQAPGATPDDWALLGCLCADTGDLTTARSALEKAIQLGPGLVMAQFALGKLLATIGEYPVALERLQHAAQLEPENADIWQALGITAGLAQQPVEAEEYCRRSLELSPESVQTRFNLANALQAQGKLSEAESEYEAAVNAEPGMAAAWSMLAQARLGLRKFDEAETAATRALELNPQSGEAHYNLGMAAAGGGDNARARDCFREAAALLPNLFEAHMRLGQALFSLNEFEDATDSFQTAVNLDSENSQAHYLLGQCFEERKLRGRAERCYRRVLELEPDHLQAHYCLAFIYSHLDRNAEAAKHFAEVVRLNPADEQAKHLLAAQQGQTTDTAPSAYVATLFDGFADTFDTKLVDELGYRTPEVLHEIVSQGVASAPGSLDVIDLGCGTGLCAPLFRDMARTLHGVDLSSRMIDKARERALYDNLEVGDIVSSLNAATAAWDLVISSDVFVYIGDLRETFTACAKALRPGGAFAFSVEAGDDVDGFVLRNTGRYAHASSYIENLAAETGFSLIEQRSVMLRKDKGQTEINGHLFLLRLTTGTD